MKAHYYNICIRVTVAETIQFDKVESISIENSLESISDTATVILPRHFIEKNNKVESIDKKNLIEFIKIGNKIKIEVGYNFKYNTEFEGYITEITDDIPIILKCMDEMYKLKKSERLIKLFPNAELKKVLQFIAPNYQIVTPQEYILGKLAINNVTPYETLLELRRNYLIRSYFKDGKLYAGLPIKLVDSKVHEFNWNRNVRKSNGLKFERKENTYYLKMTAKEKGTGNQISVELGKKGDINKEINYGIGISREDLKIIANDLYNGIVNTKCTGTFESWGIPQTRAGDTAEIITPNFPDGSRNGRYVIETVKISLNASDGFKRENTLGAMLYK